MTQAHSVALVNRHHMALRDWSSVLSSREQFETSTYSHPDRRERSIASRIVSKYLIATGSTAAFRRLTMPQIVAAGNPEWRQVEVLSGTAAKRSAPQIFRHGNAYTDVSASSSHCGPYTASLIARTRAGLDLERIEVRHPDFYANMFSPAEKQWVSGQFGPGRSHELFTFLWTVKEAFLKACRQTDLSIWNFSQWSVEASAALEESLAQRELCSAGLAIIRSGRFSQDVEIEVQRVDDMILTSLCYRDATDEAAFDRGAR
jgi:phosphopantetheinyl transferase